jgi:hypothetical protein
MRGAHLLLDLRARDGEMDDRGRLLAVVVKAGVSIIVVFVRVRWVTHAAVGREQLVEQA